MVNDNYVETENENSIDMQESQRDFSFGKEDYQRVHELAYSYQAGCQDAAVELIKAFETFINKFVSLIKFSQYDISHFSIRSFIKLYAEDSAERACITPYFKGVASKSIVADRVAGKISGIFKNTEECDIKQEALSAFLTMCKNYKDEKPSFHSYIKKNFHYYMFRHLGSISSDPVARGHTLNVPKTSGEYNADTSGVDVLLVDMHLGDKSIEIEMEEALAEIELHFNLKKSSRSPIKTKKISMYDDAFLNDNWINGITCSDIFKKLTPFERKILVLWYIENKTDTMIACEFGVCRGTINKRRAEAKANLKREVLKSKHVRL